MVFFRYANSSVLDRNLEKVVINADLDMDLSILSELESIALQA
jgi:hypothetical protein